MTTTIPEAFPLAPIRPFRALQIGRRYLVAALRTCWLALRARATPLVRRICRLPLACMPGKLARHPAYRSLVRTLRRVLPESPAAYRASHRSLLVDITEPGLVPEGVRPLRIGAIFLPVVRSFRTDLPGLRHAADLALSLGCPLIVACSRDAKVSEFPKDLRELLKHQSIVFDYNRVSSCWHPDLKSDKLRLGREHRRNDAAGKRNIALSLAALCGWESVLFMDDDIHPFTDGRATMDKAGLGLALAALGCHPGMQMVGWSATEAPDNSVFGHTRRLVRLEQSVFFGAGALLVRTGGAGHTGTTFFPNIYNHDWMFAVAQGSRAADARRSMGIAGEVRQLPYRMFKPSRARAEEVGDIFGEGLMNLFERFGNRWHHGSTASYWRAVLRHRQGLNDLLSRRVEKRRKQCSANPGSTGGSVYELNQALDSLEAAGRVADQVTQTDLQNYVIVWRADEREHWPAHLAALQRRFGPMIKAPLPQSPAPEGALHPLRVLETILVPAPRSGPAPLTPDPEVGVTVAA